MALIPGQSAGTLSLTVDITPAASQTTRTYKMDLETGRVTGYVDGTEAMRQAILKILLTERFAYLIYSWDYGIELNGTKAHCAGGIAGRQPDYWNHGFQCQSARQAYHIHPIHSRNNFRGNPGRKDGDEKCMRK